MSQAPPSATFTSDLREAFEAETEVLLRRRFLRLAGTMTILGLVVWIAALSASLVWARAASQVGVADAAAAAPLGQRLIGPVLGLLNTGIACACFFAVRRRPVRRGELIKASYLLVIADGLIRVVLARADATGSLGLFGVMLTHALACAFLPWTPREAVRPLVPVLFVWAALHLTGHPWVSAGTWLSVLMAPFIGVPGVVICWLRDTRRLAAFKLRFFQNRYGEVRRQLVDARRIHEALFPRPIDDGPVRLSYEYEPMRQIGGDYLFAHRLQPRDDGLGRLNVVLLDVTGHGITAALTVNRLYGELSRIFAEQPFVGPGEVLRLLNRYAHLTLSDHGVFATAVCARVDLDADALEYASAGHPPAFVRAVDGTLHELESTALMLGASPDGDFAPDPRTVRFGPGDALIAYTDGAMEARGINNAMLGLVGLRRLLAGSRAASGQWPRLLRGAVAAHRLGPPADDTLFVEVSRPVSTAPATRRGGRASGLFRAGAA